MLGAQFERTLIVAEDDAEVSYLEGCTAPSYDKNQVRPGFHCFAVLRQRAGFVWGNSAGLQAKWSCLYSDTCWV